MPHVPYIPCRYLGLYVSQDEAAMAYDREAIMQRGRAAQTNFSLDLYADLFNSNEFMDCG